MKEIETSVLACLSRVFPPTQHVNTTREEVEALLVAEILDGNIAGTIDQVGGFLELKPPCVQCVLSCFGSVA